MVVFGGKIAMIFGLGADLVDGMKLGLHGIILGEVGLRVMGAF